MDTVPGAGDSEVNYNSAPPPVKSSHREEGNRISLGEVLEVG